MRMVKQRQGSATGAMLFIFHEAHIYIYIEKEKRSERKSNLVKHEYYLRFL